MLAVESDEGAQLVWCIATELLEGLGEIQGRGDARQRRRHLVLARVRRVCAQCECQHLGCALHSNRLAVLIARRREQRHKRFLLITLLAKLHLLGQLAHLFA